MHGLPPGLNIPADRSFHMSLRFFRSVRPASSSWVNPRRGRCRRTTAPTPVPLSSLRTSPPDLAHHNLPAASAGSCRLTPLLHVSPQHTWQGRPVRQSRISIESNADRSCLP